MKAVLLPFVRRKYAIAPLLHAIRAGSLHTVAEPHATSTPISSSSPKIGVGSIATRWRELQGSGSWAGLLDPLDSDLRASVISYGELVQAAYDGFNADSSSPGAGKCIYSCAGLLAASGVSHPEFYNVTKFLYAICDFRPWLEPGSSVTKAMFVLPETTEELLREGKVQPEAWSQTNWIGYVAVATDEGAKALGRRDIVVAWRGTVKQVEYIKDADIRFTSAAPVLGRSDSFKNAKVHRGFLSVYTAAPRLALENQRLQTDAVPIMTSAREQAVTEVRKQMEVYKDEVTSITVTGHSLGGALATLNAVDMVAHGMNGPSSKQQPCPVTAILFASPRVGNDDFKHAFASLPQLRALAVINKNDSVPNLPPLTAGYVDTETAVLPIDTTRSPYLRPGDIHTYHNLVANSKLVDDRDVALVNKGSNALKEGYPVPAEWWVANSKGTVKGLVGRWKLENFKDE